MPTSSIIIVSNRLPTKVQRNAAGLRFQPSEGGRATELGSVYYAHGNVWVGWPGLFVEDPAEQGQVTERLADPDARNVQRQAFARMLWSKQYYCYDMAQWLDGDPNFTAPPSERHHLYDADIISIPDKWEYP